MSDLRSKTIRLAATMPKGSTERKALLGVLAGALPGKFDDFDDFDDVGVEPSAEDDARYAFERVVGRAVPEMDIRDALRRIPSGIDSFLYARKLTSRPNPMWYVWGDTNKAGAARLAKALFKGRTPRTKRSLHAANVYYSILYIGLDDGKLAKFIAPEGLSSEKS